MASFCWCIKFGVERNCKTNFTNRVYVPLTTSIWGLTTKTWMTYYKVYELLINVKVDKWKHHCSIVNKCVNFKKDARCVCETRMPAVATKSKKATFSIKVTRSLTLVWFERVFKVVLFWFFLGGVISWVYMSNIKPKSPIVQKLLQRLKFIDL